MIRAELPGFGRLASHDRLFGSCELGPIYYHNSHFESAINLQANV